MNLKDRNLRVALMKAIADAINAEVDDERADHLLDLRDRYEDEGTKSFDVKLPDGSKVATISLAIPTAKTVVVDEEAFLEYVKANMPTALRETVVPAVEAWDEVIHHPATPEQTVYAVDPKMTGTLLKGARPIDGPGPVVDDDGVVIDGVEHTPAGTPKSFSVRYETTGREALALAYRGGRLDHLIGGTTLPALEASKAIPMPAVPVHPDDCLDPCCAGPSEDTMETLDMLELLDLPLVGQHSD